MIGICALCQKKSDLKKSHMIPKWVYRRVCDIDMTGAKAPICIADGSAVLSNKQTTKYLLCSHCEQRFSKCEDYLAGITVPDNDQIKLFKNITRLDTPRKLLVSLNKDEDANQIAYFAASIIWRGCVMAGACTLGPYESKFRKYLLGAIPLPPEVVISVGLLEQSPDTDVRGWVSQPVSKKTRIGWLHGFLLAGLVFRCWVGKSVPPEWQGASLTGRNPKKYVSILKPSECADFLAAAEVVASAKARGKLAKSARFVSHAALPIDPGRYP